MREREIFRSEGLPVFQNKMFATAEEAKACPTGEVVLVQNMDTGLVYNSAFDPSLLIYDADYQNEQSCSAVFQHHLQNVSRIIEPHFSGKSLIEVGCGKGYFLEYLKTQGYRITGIDPAYEGNSPDVVAATFEPGLGMTADGIILRHVLEHIVDPVDFLRQIRDANGGSGLIYIEVPCFDWIRRNKAWFDIFYEHVNYFRLSDFYRMFANVIDSGHLFGGQYLYVMADLTTIRQPAASPNDLISLPDDFMSDVECYAARIRNEKERVNLVWGAASKGVIFSIYMRRAGAIVDEVIDINPAKQGKYIATTGLKVMSPWEAQKLFSSRANVFVMNPNYTDEIKTMIGDANVSLVEVGAYEAP